MPPIAVPRPLSDLSDPTTPVDIGTATDNELIHLFDDLDASSGVPMTAVSAASVPAGDDGPTSPGHLVTIPHEHVAADSSPEADLNDDEDAADVLDLDAIDASINSAGPDAIPDATTDDPHLARNPTTGPGPGTLDEVESLFDGVPLLTRTPVELPITLDWDDDPAIPGLRGPADSARRS